LPTEGITFGLGVHVCSRSGPGDVGHDLRLQSVSFGEYLEGRLAPELAGEVQRHLSYCHDCRTIFDAAALTLEVYFDREVEPAPADRSRVA
jgi:hypothetical protein